MAIAARYSLLYRLLCLFRFHFLSASILLSGLILSQVMSQVCRKFGLPKHALIYAVGQIISCPFRQG